MHERNIIYIFLSDEFGFIHKHPESVPKPATRQDKATHECGKKGPNTPQQMDTIV